jgi:hypothetical protein
MNAAGDEGRLDHPLTGRSVHACATCPTNVSVIAKRQWRHVL